jgi:hypothetical protein
MSTGSSVPPGEEGEELSLQEIRGRYKDRWVAITVTKRDRSLQPVGGVVVADDPDRYRLRDMIAKYREVCIVYAGDPLYPLIM